MDYLLKILEELFHHTVCSYVGCFVRVSVIELSQFNRRHSHNPYFSLHLGNPKM